MNNYLMTIKVNGLIRTGMVLGAASLFVGGAWAADAAAGKATFATKCRTCHGADGGGNAAMAKALSVEIKPPSDRPTFRRKATGT